MTRSDDTSIDQANDETDAVAVATVSTVDSPDWSLVHFDVACARCCGRELRGQVEPKCPDCQLEFDWADAVPLEKLTCAKCDYHLFGLSEPRCPECGEAFEWNESLLNYRRRQKPLFEYRWREQPVRSLVRTWWRSLRTGKFWRSVDIHDPPQLGPLLATAILTPVVATMTWLFLAAIGEWGVNWYRWSGGWSVTYAAGQLPFYFRRATMIYALPEGGLVITAWMAGSLTTMLVLRQSMRRHRVRSRHAIRAWAYAVSGQPAVGVFLFAAYTFVLLLWRPWGRPNTDLALLLVAIVLLHSVCSIRCAYYHYLRMPHSLGIALASQVVAILAAVLTCVLWEHIAFTRIVLALEQLVGLS